MAYVQPGTHNPTPNDLVFIRPTPNANALNIGENKVPNYVQPDYRPVTVDARVDIVPMFNGRVVGDK